MVLKEEFSSWKRSECYAEMYKALKEQAEIYAEEIIGREQVNPERDQLLRGRIQALTGVMAWEPEFPVEPKEDGNDDEV